MNDRAIPAITGTQDCAMHCCAVLANPLTSDWSAAAIRKDPGLSHRNFSIFTNFSRMNNTPIRDITDVKIVELNRAQIKFWGLVAAVCFLMVSVCGNFNIRTDEFEVTLNETEAVFQRPADQPETIITDNPDRKIIPAVFHAAR